MKTVVCILTLFIIFPAFADNSKQEEFTLIPPIAKEREDGLDKLPSQTFTDNSGVETWFVQERGFQPASTTAKTENEKKSLERTPAAKKKSKSIKKKKNGKRKPASNKIKQSKKKLGVKK